MHIPIGATFQEECIEARQQADKLKFRFEKERELPLREYVEQKVMLLREANIKDEEEVVIRVWEIDFHRTNCVFKELEFGHQNHLAT